MVQISGRKTDPENHLWLIMTHRRSVGAQFKSSINIFFEWYYFKDCFKQFIILYYEILKWKNKI